MEQIKGRNQRRAGTVIRKVIFVRPSVYEPFYSRRKLKKGIIEPAKGKNLSSILFSLAITNVGKVVIDDAKKRSTFAGLKLHKEYFIGGVYKYWIKINFKDFIVDFKCDLYKHYYHTLPLCIIEVEGNCDIVKPYLSGIIEKIKVDTFNKVNLFHQLKDHKIINKYSDEELFEW